MNDDRKLDTADTFTEVFSIYGSQAGVLLPVAFGLFAISAVLSELLDGSFAGALVAFAVSILISTLYQGMVVELVSDVQDGRRDSSVGQLVRSAAPVIVPLIAAGFLAGIGIMIGFILIIVPGLILITIWSVIAPVIVVERKGVIEAFGRSRELVKGNGWRVFGVILTVIVIFIVVGLLLGALAVSLVDDSTGANIVANLIGSTLTAPVTALVASVLYFRLRRIKEGAVPEAGAPVAG
jgi:hypothetical protein